MEATISLLDYPRDIDNNLRHRIRLLQEAEKDPAFLVELRELCKRDILFWIDNFCYTKDPRRQPSVLPFICYDFQREYVLETQKAIRDQDDLLTEKSRDVGVSWMVLYVFSHFWLFEPGSDFRVGSRKEDFVDKLNDIDTLLEKVRFNLKKQPLWILPEGFDFDKYAGFMKIINPKNGNAILGESANPHFGSGGRRKALLLDEFAKWEDRIADAAWTATGDVSKCRLPVSCVSGNTIIYTNSGMKRIESVQEDNLGFFEGKRIGLYGRYGVKYTNVYYNSGIQDTLKFVAKGGYNIETSYIHPLLVLSERGLEWKKAQDIELEDLVAIQYGQQCFGDNDSIVRQFKRGKKTFRWNKIDEDLSYFMGQFLAEGYIHQGHQIIVSTGDDEIHNWLKEWHRFSRVDAHHSRVSDSNLCDFLEWFGFLRVRSPNKIIPDNILELSKKNIKAFLQGLFDGDGCASLHNGRLRVSYISTSKQIIDTLQSILLNFGITSSQHWRITLPTKKVKVESYVGVLELNSYMSDIFMKEIGFRLERKNKKYRKTTDKITIPHIKDRVLAIMKLAGRGVEYNLRSVKGSIRNKEKGNRFTQSNLKAILYAIKGKIKKCDDSKLLNELSGLNVIWCPIKHISCGRECVYDFHILDGHSFTGNGFVGHNTPVGSGNKFALLAKGTKEKIKRLTLHWTLHPQKTKGAYYFDEKNGQKLPIDNPQKAFGVWQKLKGKTAEKFGLRGGLVRSIWYDEEAERRSDADLAQEVDIDYARSGYPYFDLAALSLQRVWKYMVRKLPTDPIPYGNYIRIKFVEIDNKLEIREVPAGWLKVYELPRKDYQYAIGADTSEGLVKGDESFGVIRDKWTRNVVATFNGLYATDDFAVKLQQAGRFYNNADVAPENNNHGHSICQDLKNMDCKLYYTKKLNESTGKVSIIKAGFSTTSATRPLMLDQLEEEIRRNSIELRDEDLIAQCETFIKNEKTGKPEADGVFLDDGVIAMAICGIIIQEAPYKAKASQNIKQAQRVKELTKKKRGF
ncbi:MAG: hypothetical protein DRI61_07700 [Chloroflexi bacterium]|nr:MAG: hypothetical protein DRI61_07700 [Chloroflexota bacterium]